MDTNINESLASIKDIQGCNESFLWENSMWQDVVLVSDNLMLKYDADENVAWKVLSDVVTWPGVFFKRYFVIASGYKVKNMVINIKWITRP